MTSITLHCGKNHAKKEEKERKKERQKNERKKEGKKRKIKKSLVNINQVYIILKNVGLWACSYSVCRVKQWISLKLSVCEKARMEEFNAHNASPTSFSFVLNIARWKLLSNIMQWKEVEVSQGEKGGGKSISLTGTVCLRSYLSTLQCEIKCIKSSEVISVLHWYMFDTTFVKPMMIILPKVSYSENRKLYL